MCATLTRTMDVIAAAMLTRAKENVPFTDGELDTVITSLRRIVPRDLDAAIQWDELRHFLTRNAHLSHTDWEKTAVR